jgi:arylsulfatase A-like enzyme
MVMNLDFAQTFLDIAGVEQPADMQGQSLAPILAGNTPNDWRKEVYYHYYEFPGAHSVRRHFGIRTDRYKLIRFYNIDESELFDLEQDPNELHSVYDDAQYAEIRGNLTKRLAALQTKYKDDTGNPEPLNGGVTD